jgi:hypothetical protein
MGNKEAAAAAAAVLLQQNQPPSKANFPLFSQRFTPCITALGNTQTHEKILSEFTANMTPAQANDCAQLYSVLSAGETQGAPMYGPSQTEGKMPVPLASATTSDCNVKELQELQDMYDEAEYTEQSPSASMSNMNVQPAAETQERLRTASIGIGVAVNAGGRPYVAELQPGGAAATSGSLQVGDVLLSVQAMSLASLSRSEGAEAHFPCQI